MHLKYALYFTQVPVNRDCYMNIPKVIFDNDWLLNYKKNKYGKHQIGRVWNKLLVEKLTISEVGFRKIKIYEGMFYQGESIYILYTGDYILA